MSESVKPAQVLDTRGLRCPLPLLRAKKALNTLESGQILLVIATDAGAEQDFKAFARQTNNKLVDWFFDAGEYHFYLEKNQ